MVRKTEKGGKFRNVHCKTWNMLSKLNTRLKNHQAFIKEITFLYEEGIL